MHISFVLVDGGQMVRKSYDHTTCQLIYGFGKSLSSESNSCRWRYLYVPDERRIPTVICFSFYLKQTVFLSFLRL